MKFVCCNCQADKLPDVLLYAGDTTPWNVALLQENGNPYPYSEMEDAVAILTFMPYSFTSGIGSDAMSIQPELTVVGYITNNGEGAAVAVFEPSYSDTFSMHGKYIYQVTISNQSDVRVRQGFATIRYNIDRAENGGD